MRTTLREGCDRNSRRRLACGLHTEGMEGLVLQDAQYFAELALPWMAADPYSTNVIGATSRLPVRASTLSGETASGLQSWRVAKSPEWRCTRLPTISLYLG